MWTFLWIWWCMGVAVAAPRPPSVDRVDYESHSAALALPASIGDRTAIEALARQIGGDTFEEKLHRIGQWMATHQKLDAEMAYTWRNFDSVVADGTYGGCADYALVYGVIARASGIPVVWVKTMDVSWIREFTAGRQPQVWSGHVFLEVHNGKKWVLLDPTDQSLYEEYDPRSRLLPGNRFAYDKGVDPYVLVLSTRWEEWKEQARAYFKGFDTSQLPVTVGRPVWSERMAFIAGSNPGWDLAQSRIQSLGWKVGRSGNSEFAAWMPLVPGRTLVVLHLGTASPLPASYSSTYERVPITALLEKHHGQDSWVEAHRAEDGTRVLVVYGRDEHALSEAIASLTLEQ